MSADLICVNFIGINYLYNTFKGINFNKENIIINMKIISILKLECDEFGKFPEQIQKAI